MGKRLGWLSVFVCGITVITSRNPVTGQGVGKAETVSRGQRFDLQKSLLEGGDSCPIYPGYEGHGGTVFKGCRDCSSF